MQNDLKNELHNIISGKSKVRFGTTIQAITSYHNNGSQAGSTIEIEKSFKRKETKILEDYISEKNLG